MNLSPEIVIVSGDKFTLIMRPVFGEYYSVLSEEDQTILIAAMQWLKYVLDEYSNLIFPLQVAKAKKLKSKLEQTLNILENNYTVTTGVFNEIMDELKIAIKEVLKNQFGSY